MKKEVLGRNGVNYLEERTSGKRAILNLCSKCGLQTSSLKVTWEFVRNADSGACPRSAESESVL